MSARYLTAVHLALGLGPLSAYVVYHLWENLAALRGREYWLQRQLEAGTPNWVVVLLAVALAAHAGLGVLRYRRRELTDLALRGRQRAQAILGTTVLLFLGVHLAHVLPTDHGPHATPLRAHAALSHHLPHPIAFAVYCVGTSAVCLHLAHGLSQALERATQSRPVAVRTLVRLFAGVCGLVLWFAFMQVLGYFAVGDGLFFPLARG